MGFGKKRSSKVGVGPGHFAETAAQTPKNDLLGELVDAPGETTIKRSVAVLVGSASRGKLRMHGVTAHTRAKLHHKLLRARSSRTALTPTSRNARSHRAYKHLLTKLRQTAADRSCSCIMLRVRYNARTARQTTIEAYTL